jgi:hypothetical protein
VEGGDTNDVALLLVTKSSIFKLELYPEVYHILLVSFFTVELFELEDDDEELEVSVT